MMVEHGETIAVPKLEIRKVLAEPLVPRIMMLMKSGVKLRGVQLESSSRALLKFSPSELPKFGADKPGKILPFGF